MIRTVQLLLTLTLMALLLLPNTMPNSQPAPHGTSQRIQAQSLLHHAYNQGYAWQQLLVEGLEATAFERALARFHEQRRLTRDGLQQMVGGAGEADRVVWQGLMQSHAALDGAFRLALERYQVVQQNPKGAAVAVMPDYAAQFLNPLQQAVVGLQQDGGRARSVGWLGAVGLMGGLGLVIGGLLLGTLLLKGRYGVVWQGSVGLLNGLWPKDLPPLPPIRRGGELAWMEQALLRLTQAYKTGCEEITAQLASRPEVLDGAPRGLWQGGSGSPKDIHGVVVVVLEALPQLAAQWGTLPLEQRLRDTLERLQQPLEGVQATVALWGMDAIAVRLPPLPEQLALAGWVSRISAVVHGPSQQDPLPLPWRGQIGVALGADGDLSAALRRAWLAAHQPKQGGYRCYAAPQDGPLEGLQSWLSLSVAVQARQGEPRFTPVVTLREGGMAYLEMTMQWQHANGAAVVWPEGFSTWQNSLQLPGVAFWLLEQAIYALHRWGERTLSLLVDLQGWPLPEREMVGRLRTLLVRLQVQPQQLVLLMDHQSWNESLQQRAWQGWQALGCGLAIGGIAGVAQWQSWPEGCMVRLDGHVLQRMQGEGSGAAAELEAMALMAREQGMQLLVSGVENRIGLELSKSLGCDAFAGAFIAEPMDETSFLQWRNHSPWVGGQG
ncbi:diguanylate phosphodiesterase [Magnetococcus marinus MC-1]|uniref:Diguanylate phosphodiesterase n=1 Tax=Magnetococcus marinus (strain ATCC BAA-1437 / JCM 17883 / MC-1) TaxID=156889 RepID=A0LCM1_MAGMM|nr:EAL domain-containing protein [Magnetococcus marinus]ABK45714.1 diguanylate phosphodiesterase [Magnetococcus marinus MC-1]